MSNSTLSLKKDLILKCAPLKGFITVSSRSLQVQNFGFEKVLGLKKMLGQKKILKNFFLVVLKCFGFEQNFGFENEFFVWKNFRSEKIVVLKTNFGSEKILVTKNFLTPKFLFILGPKNVGYAKKFGSEKCWVQTIFWSEKNFGSENILGPKYTLALETI